MLRDLVFAPLKGPQQKLESAVAVQQTASTQPRRVISSGVDRFVCLAIDLVSSGHLYRPDCFFEVLLNDLSRSAESRNINEVCLLYTLASVALVVPGNGKREIGNGSARRSVFDFRIPSKAPSKRDFIDVHRSAKRGFRYRR